MKQERILNARDEVRDVYPGAFCRGQRETWGCEIHTSRWLWGDLIASGSTPQEAWFNAAQMVRGQQPGGGRTASPPPRK